eukprot:SAG31_NODE_32416_length_356_cov_0.801556_1_plen_42_part_10
MRRPYVDRALYGAVLDSIKTSNTGCNRFGCGFKCGVDSIEFQ